MNELELTVTRTIPAPREKVFDAWLSPKILGQFMRPSSSMTSPSKVTNDPVKGGQFTILMISEGRELPHTGTYLEIDPYSRLSFTWASENSLDDSVVTIDFTEPKPGTTDITLKQVKFRSEAERQGHTQGWTAIIEQLEKILA
ncbi:SRPBCC domain-containing protein [Mesorhizobium sp. SB112]|uniref:SRPBCC family protein n=1 Tax=Mesorhizobium sp. SB112 TaxID=3151853 RepID=UPI0032658ABB